MNHDPSMSDEPFTCEPHLGPCGHDPHVRLAAVRTEHSAACYDCAYQSPWTIDRAEADDARLEHEGNSPAHRITVISRAA